MFFVYVFIICCGLLALLSGLLLIRSVLSASAGNERMQKIARAIQEGARAYLNRQYQVIGCVGVVIFAIIVWLLKWHVGFGFVVGALLSAIAGYIGMHVSVRANVRTAEAARRGLQPALNISFKAGAVTGLLVVGLGLLGIVGSYLALMYLEYTISDVLEALIGLGFGASLISIFARLGGGIFTKGADVGADLVGKIEAGIPEDDPRNPAVIADNVGDNVGDCAGMAADLFETYVVTIVGTMLLAGIYFKGAMEQTMMLYPLLIGAVCILTTIIGTFFVRLGKSENIMNALYKGFVSTALMSVVAIFFVTKYFVGFDESFTVNALTFKGINLFWCALTGLVVTGLLMWITEYYTLTNIGPFEVLPRPPRPGMGRTLSRG